MTNTPLKLLLVAACSVELGLAHERQLLANVLTHVRIAAITGQQAPGTPAGTVFTGLAHPVLNNAGQIAFGAQVRSPSGPESYRNGIWIEDAGQTGLIALDNTRPPGIEFPTYGGPINFSLNDRGEVHFAGPVVDETTGESVGGGVWVGTASSLELRFSTTETLSHAGSDVQIRAFGIPVVNRNGALAFSGATSNYAAVWTLSANELSQVVRTGTHPPGVPPLNRFWRLANRPLFNSHGRISIYANITPDAGGVWSNARGPLELVVRNDAPAPGLGPGVRFGSLITQVLNARGDLVFRSPLVGENVTADNSDSLWIWRDGQLRLIAREGDTVPGQPGVHFLPGSDYIRAVSSDDGQIAFLSRLRGEGIVVNDDWAIWSYRDDSLQLIAQSGLPAPGTEVGTTFVDLESPIINHLGQIAFGSSLAGPTVSQINDWGIWAEDRQGNLQLIVREGDTMDIDPGPGETLRTITQAMMLNSHSLFSYNPRGEGDQAYAFNNRGQVAFQVGFADGTQAVVISNRLLVPEPAGAVLAAAGSVALCIAGLRRRARQH